MTLKHLRIFLTVCNENSITKAANKLYKSQPAVSLAIREMEDFYGVKLFDRVSHHLYLTEPGRTMRDYADGILHQFDEMEQILSQQTASQSLKVGNSVGSTLFTTLMKKFEDTHPNIQTTVVTDHTSTVVQKVKNNEFDIATIEGLASSPELSCTVFAKDTMVVIASPSHPLAKRRRLTSYDLIQERFLMREQHCGTRTVVEQVFRSKGITITPYWESSASQVIIDAVCVGIGISVLPYSLVSSYVKNGDLAILDVCDVKFERPFSIIYYTHKYQTKAFKSFYQFFLEQASNCDPDGRMP